MGRVVKLDPRTVNDSAIKWRLLSHCPLTHVKEWHGYFEDDRGNGHTILKQEYPAEMTKLLLQANNEQAIEADRHRYGDGFTKVASIPMNIWQDRLGEATQNKDRKALKQFLNDSDNAKFRTKSGTV